MLDLVKDEISGIDAYKYSMNTILFDEVMVEVVNVEGEE
jgi:hypothetical protein